MSKSLIIRITKSYRIYHSDTTALINKDTAKFASKLQIVDKLGKIEEKCAYILFKVHKQNIQDRKQVKLINPTKTELSLVPQDLMQRITSWLLSSPKYNLWGNSMDTIDWFKNIKNKKMSTFIQFDIIEIYPSITRELLLKKPEPCKGIYRHHWRGTRNYFSI